MDVRISARKGNLPQETKRFAEEKLGHLGRFLSTITEVEVELYEDGKPKDGRGHVASVRVHTGGPVFRSKAASSDFHTAIDIAYARLERRVKEFKRQRSGKPKHSRPPGADADNPKGRNLGEPAG
jgi:ribosomal subunit interface protein